MTAETRTDEPTADASAADARARRYSPAEIQRHWQQQWEADGLYVASTESEKPKYYALVMFPYTSGDLHIGHWYNYRRSPTRTRATSACTASTSCSRWASTPSGCPPKTPPSSDGIHPYTWTMRQHRRAWSGQIKTMGGIYDWSKKLATCLPEYYSWNQWFFLQVLRARPGLPARWRPSTGAPRTRACSRTSRSSTACC